MTGEDQNAQAPKTSQQRGRLQTSHLHCHGYGHFRSGGTRLEELRAIEVNHAVHPASMMAGKLSSVIDSNVKPRH
jgi:hypothetical protein